MHKELKTDELPGVLEQINNSAGAEKADLLNSIAAHYIKTSEYEAALKHALEAKELSQELLYREGLSQSLLLLAKASYFLFDYVSSIEYLNVALPMLQDSADRRDESDALNFLGNNQWSLGDYSAALETHFKNLKIRQSLGLKHSEAQTLMNIGNCYIRMRELEQSLEFYGRAYKIEKEHGSKADVKLVLRNMGNVYMEIPDFEKALECYKQSLDGAGDDYYTGQALLNMGNAYVKLNKFDEALDFFSRGKEIFTKLNNHENICLAILSAAELYSEKKEYLKSLENLEAGLKIAEEKKFVSMIEYSHNAKAQIYLELKDYKNAHEEFMKFYQMEKKRINEASQVKTKYLNVMHKVESIQKETEILTEKNKELNELNNKLTELNNEKNEFLGIAAHDLKNPLTSISLSAATLKKYLRTFSFEKIETHLDKIEQTSKRMKNIVSNLLDINAIESGKYNVQKTEINLSALVKYIADDYEQRSKQKSISIDVVEHEEIKISTDEQAIYEILENLISNSVKYSPANSKVEISVTKTDKVTIRVKDNGPGIQDSEKGKVFQKFSKLSNKPTGGENSTGLGLSIVKRLTELIGGNITFQSEFGNGTTFILELPL